MTFEEAYDLMKSGKAVSLPELLANNEFFYLSGGFEIPRESITNPAVYEYFNNNPKYIHSLDTGVLIEPHIDMKNAQGHLEIGVEISSKDMKRDDWLEFDVLNE